MREVLELNTVRSAALLREFLGPITLQPIDADIGRPHYRAVTSIDALALIDTPTSEGGRTGSNSLRQWAR